MSTFRTASACLVALVLAQPTVSALAASGTTSTPCFLPGLAHEARCGRVARPLDPARPDGVKIDIHYAVIPATARSPKSDPMVFFAGGPGQSALDLVPQIAAMLSRLHNLRDIVLIDQRGTGRSAPLLCERDDPARPLAEQLDAARQREKLLACRDQLAAQPHGDLRQYATWIAAQDVESVRLAIGAPRVNVVGVSYGTRVALEYLRQYPKAVRRAVLDGVAPPDMVLPVSMAADNQAALDALLDACAAAQACRARHRNLRARWQALLGRLPVTASVAHPVTGRPETVTFTRSAVASAVRSALYSPALSAALPAAIESAADGRFEALAALASAVGGRRGVGVATGMHFSVVCSEDAPRMAAAAAAASAAVAAPDFGVLQRELYADVCAQWPRAAVPPAFYEVPPSPVPVLLLSGGIDPATPPRHGERVARLLGPKARHVTVPNAGHGVLGLGCMRDVLFRFVDAPDEREAMAVDAGCAARVPRPPAFESFAEPRP